MLILKNHYLYLIILNLKHLSNLKYLYYILHKILIFFMSKFINDNLFFFYYLFMYFKFFKIILIFYQIII